MIRAAPSGRPPGKVVVDHDRTAPASRPGPPRSKRSRVNAQAAEPSIPGARGSRIHVGIHDRRSVVMASHLDSDTGEKPSRGKLPLKLYEKELARLQEELVKMEEWVQRTGARIVVVFEG